MIHEINNRLSQVIKKKNCSVKDYVKGIRRQATDREKIFGKYMFNERLLSKIYKECLKLNNTQNPLQYCKAISL